METAVSSRLQVSGKFQIVEGVNLIWKGKQVTGLVHGRNKQTGWELQLLLTGHTIRSATNPLLISHLFPAAALIVRSYSEGGSRQWQAFSSDPARATAAPWRAHHVTSEISFLRDLAKGPFPILSALFQAEHIHPPQAWYIVAGLPFYFPQILFRQILSDFCPPVHPSQQLTDTLGCAGAE